MENSWKRPKNQSKNRQKIAFLAFLYRDLEEEEEEEAVARVGRAWTTTQNYSELTGVSRPVLNKLKQSEKVGC